MSARPRPSDDRYNHYGDTSHFRFAANSLDPLWHLGRRLSRRSL